MSTDVSSTRCVLGDFIERGSGILGFMSTELLDYSIYLAEVNRGSRTALLTRDGEN